MSRTDWCECPSRPAPAPPATRHTLPSFSRSPGCRSARSGGSRGSRRTSGRPAACRPELSRSPARPCPARRSRTRRSGRRSAPRTPAGRVERQVGVERHDPGILGRARDQRRRAGRAPSAGPRRSSRSGNGTRSSASSAWPAARSRRFAVATSSSAMRSWTSGAGGAVELVQAIRRRHRRVLGERDALPLDRVGHDDLRLALLGPDGAQRPTEVVQVVAVAA